jgi:hypothetical protein
MATADPNNTDKRRPEGNFNVERVGDITDTLHSNITADRDKAIKMTRILEGLEYPATKQQIQDHLNRKSAAMGNRINDILEAIRNNLDDYIKYNSAFDIEQAAHLVINSVSHGEGKKPFIRDEVDYDSLKYNRMAEKKRHSQFSGTENIWPANERNVSPNTPLGEEI